MFGARIKNDKMIRKSFPRKLEEKNLLSVFEVMVNFPTADPGGGLII
jgi:hypothetical protein